MNTSSLVDVLIVGAGPTGTALAIDLTRRGVGVRIIDSAAHGFEGSRAKGVQPRTLEVLYDLGALPDVLSGGSLYPPMGVHVGPLTVPVRMMKKGKPGPDVPYPDTWLIPQSRTNRALHARLEALGTRVELGTELAGLLGDDTHVTVQVSTEGGTEQIMARYVVGADGGSSAVRKQTGVAFTGTTDEADRMLIVDAVVEGALSRDYWHVWPGLGGRFIGACPLPHTGLFQWMIRLAPGEDPPEGIEEITRKIRAHTRNKHLSVTEIAWKSVFRPNIRLAETYRHGRVLLAGDAAHVHTPAGAQGLNTGIGDAYNLGWKLAQVLAGAPPSLLDTYEGERRPIAAAVLGLSTKKYNGIGKLDPSSYKRGQDEKQLTLTYYGGPLASTQADETTTLRVGDRAPDAELFDDTGKRFRLFETYQGTHFTALASGKQALIALSELQWPAEGAPLRRIAVDDAVTDARNVAVLDATGHFGRTYGLRGDTLILVRPDGYIGHIATRDFLASTRAAITTWIPSVS
ncbi:FAD-dependent monooxygenase [Nocardia sp. NPDC050697]|uniref:FAD-dependent monooxygenase n=1 Tax=Nocardia sp. NPDC050697 TaxID=3155158 RepID=UPI0033CFA3F5